MSAPRNLRDLVERFVPSWLGDNDPSSPSYGFRVLWGAVAIVDGVLEVMMQGSLASTGKGTPTALEYIGQARGLIRHQDETDAEYGRRLSTWIDRAKENGSGYRLPLAIHDYLRSHPRVRVFRRGGHCLTVDTDRTITIDAETAWDWDSVSHPERNTVEAPWWSDLFIVVYARGTVSDPIEQWPHRPGGMADLTGEDGFVLGHMATNQEVDAIKGLVQLCKAAHTCVRAVIWTSDPALFVPSDDASMPDGTWGTWSTNVAGSQVASGRNVTTCRYWEPR